MLNNNSFLALFVFLTYCFASDPTKLHRVFSNLVHPLLYMRKMDLTYSFARTMMFAGERKKYLLFSPVNKSTL